MEIILIKKILARNLLIYIGLHCVNRLMWTTTTLATLVYVCELLISRLTVDTLRKTADNKNEFFVHTKSLLIFSRLKWWEFHLCRGCKRSNSENCHFSRTPFISRNEVGFNTKKTRGQKIACHFWMGQVFNIQISWCFFPTEGILTDYKHPMKA